MQGNIWRSGWVIGLSLVVITIGVLALSAVFAQSDQIVRMADHAKTLQASEELLAAATAQRGAVAVGIMMTEAQSRGYASDEQRNVTILDIRATSDQLIECARWLDELIEAQGEIEGLATAAASQGTAVADLLSTGRTVGADAAVTSLVDSVERLRERVASIRTEAYALTLAEEGTAGRLARATSIAVGLLLPGLAFIAYRWLLTRRQERIRLQMTLAHQQERARIKDEMIGNLSHQLRTPLAAVYAAALTIQQEDDDPDLRQELIGIIVGQSNDLSRMVDDLLVVAKVDAGELEIAAGSVDVSREVDAAVSSFQGTEHPIRVDCLPDTATGDRLRVRHVVRNLVSNAVKHGGGRIAVTGRVIGDRYCISVYDEGPGVPDGLEPLLFDRYVHSGETPLLTGTLGMGLAVAKTLAERMNGELTYDHAGGVTSFKLWLPLEHPARVPAAVAAL